MNDLLELTVGKRPGISGEKPGWGTRGEGVEEGKEGEPKAEGQFTMPMLSSKCNPNSPQERAICRDEIGALSAGSATR
jgi:hypothetical protein